MVQGPTIFYRTELPPGAAFPVLPDVVVQVPLLNIRAILEDIHSEFERFSVGNAQFITAIGHELPLLFGVPALFAYPAGTVFVEE